MKIIKKAAHIKPGMLIETDNKSIVLVTAIQGKIKIEYTHLDYETSINGLMVGTIDRDTKIKIITGEEKTLIVNLILKNTYQELSSINSIVDTIKLIKSMDDN